MLHSDYRELLNQRRAWYKGIRKCYCNILDEEVFFNSKGFYHLLYDGFGHGRTEKERMSRLLLLPLAPAIIQEATSVAEIRKIANCEYWKLTRQADKKNVISVILRRVGKSQIIFFSIWRGKMR